MIRFLLICLLSALCAPLFAQYSGDEVIYSSDFQTINSSFLPTRMLKAHHVLLNPESDAFFVGEEYRYAINYGLSDHEAKFFAIQAYRSTNPQHSGDHSSTPPEAWYAAQKVANAIYQRLRGSMETPNLNSLTRTVGKTKLNQLHPLAKYGFFKLLEMAEARGWSASILSGFRSLQSQAKLVQRGRSGSIVSSHNVGLGIDIKFINAYGQYPSVDELRDLRNALYATTGIFIGEIFHYIDVDKQDQAHSTAHERNHWNLIPNSHNFSNFILSKE